MTHNPEHLPADVHEAVSRFDNYELLHRQMGELADAIHRTADIVFCSEEPDEVELVRSSIQVKRSSDAAQQTVEDILKSLIFDDATSLDEKLLQAHDLVHEDWILRHTYFTEALGEPLDDDQPDIGDVDEEAEFKEDSFGDFKIFHGRGEGTVDLNTLCADILADYYRESDRDLRHFIGSLVCALGGEESEDYESPSSQQEPGDIAEWPE